MSKSVFDHASAFTGGRPHHFSPVFGAGSDVAAYPGNDVNDAAAGTGAPPMLTQASQGAGPHHGGTTSSGGASASVSGAAGTGLTINVTYEASVGSAPAGFTSVISQVV